EVPEIIQGGEHEDARGRLTFFNDFDMKAVRRFYVIEHPDTAIVRAWQAHKKEQKWFYVTAGSFKIFAFPGDGINGMLAAWGRAGNKPKFIQSRHEEMSGFEAVGYAGSVAPGLGLTLRTADVRRVAGTA
ncbi:MAG: hypothetical protein ABIR83_03080, partial [Nakamurella sp.]